MKGGWDMELNSERSKSWSVRIRRMEIHKDNREEVSCQ